MKKLTIILITILVATAAAALYQIPAPKIIFNYEKFYELRRKDNGKILSEETRILTNPKYDGKEFIVMKVDSEGKRRPSRRILTYFTLKDGLMTAYSHKVETIKNGKPVETTLIDFDWEKMMATFTKEEHEKGKTSAKTIELNPKTIHAQFSSFYLQKLVKDRVKKDTFWMITPTGDKYEIDAKIDYKPVQIEIEDSSIPCYKLTLKADVGFLSVFSPVLTFWYETAPPHDFVRYVGPEKGPMSPTIIQEIIQ
jgi:hypothetical protein